jgi:NADH-quinone oxidoreductase subunit J
MIEWIVFVAASAMVLGGAAAVIVCKHPVHAALGLILTLFGVAVHFISLDAHFLGAVQVIVYAGAIVVLFLFVIMLLGVDKSENLSIEPFKLQRPIAAAVGVGMAVVLSMAVLAQRDGIATAPPADPNSGVAEALTDATDGNVRALGRNLFSDHLFAFELTSVLLVIAVVGTVLLARRPPKASEMIAIDQEAAS